PAPRHLPRRDRADVGHRPLAVRRCPARAARRSRTGRAHGGGRPALPGDRVHPVRRLLRAGRIPGRLHAVGGEPRVLLLGHLRQRAHHVRARRAELVLGAGARRGRVRAAQPRAAELLPRHVDPGDGDRAPGGRAHPAARAGRGPPAARVDPAPADREEAVMAAGLVVSGLKKRYGGNWALSGVDLHVEPGELRAVIGPNGAGKSTLFGTIAGEHTPTEGTIFLDGEDLTPLSAHAKARRGIARTFQVTRNFTEMTALENVQVAVLIAMGQSRRMWRPVGSDVRSRAEQALASVNMLDQAHVIAGELSQGDRKRLEIAGALAMSPRLLLLDEPTAGMSPEETEHTADLIEELWRREGITILLTEHDIGMVFRLAARITVLDRGRLLCTGDAEEVRQREDVREIYLGVE